MKKILTLLFAVVLMYSCQEHNDSELVEANFEKSEVNFTEISEKSVIEFIEKEQLAKPNFSKETTVEQDRKLQRMYKAYISLLKLKMNCSNPGFVAYGARACGGPETYIAYSKNYRYVSYFLFCVRKYNKLSSLINEKTGAISICSIAPKPTAIRCVNGKLKAFFGPTKPVLNSTLSNAINFSKKIRYSNPTSLTSTLKTDYAYRKTIKKYIDFFKSKMTCEGPTYTGFGHRACGGPATYIAYSSTYKYVKYFEALVSRYNYVSKLINQKEGNVSICSLAPTPSSVECVDGKLKAIFSRGGVILR